MTISTDRNIFRKSLLVLLTVALLAAILLLSGCKTEIRVSEYRVMDMTILLPEGFEAYPREGIDGFFVMGEADNFAIVTVKRTLFSDANRFFANAGEWTVEQFAKYNYTTMGRKLQMNGEIPYVEYSQMNQTTGDEEYYLVSLYKGTDAFWLIIFCTRETERDNYREQFLEWSQTVRFDENE